MVKTVKFTKPQISNFSLPAVIDFGQNWTLLLWRQIRVGTPRVHLGANGVPLELKNGSKPQKIAMPQKSNFRHRFRPKFDLWVMAPNHGRELLGSILGPMGSHWGKKLGQNPKKLPCPKIGFFGNPAVIDFAQNLTVRLWRQIMVGTT